MSEKAGLSVKKSEGKEKRPVTSSSQTDFSQSLEISSPVEQVLHLQRTIGNRAVTRLIQSGVLQAKLKIGQPGDIYEQEADQMAEQVMRMSGESIVNSQWLLARKEIEPGCNVRLEESGSLIRRLRNSRWNPCSSDYLNKIDDARPTAIRRANAAKVSLENPENVEEYLWDHFKIDPGDTDKIEQIKEAFGEIAEILGDPNRITYHCLSEDTECCQGGAAGCSRAGSPNISLCEPHILDDDIETLAHTLLHEAAHAHNHSFVVDVYRHNRSEYQALGPDDALINADSYACFARDVSQ